MIYLNNKETLETRRIQIGLYIKFTHGNYLHLKEKRTEGKMRCKVAQKQAYTNKETLQQRKHEIYHVNNLKHHGKFSKTFLY